MRNIRVDHWGTGEGPSSSMQLFYLDELEEPGINIQVADEEINMYF